MSKTDLTKTEYLLRLQKYLKKLPKADYEDAMEYFTEYFEDTDDEGAKALMEELGTPKEAARDLMANLLDRKLTDASTNANIFSAPAPEFAGTNGAVSSAHTTGRKMWKSILWISLLLLFAIPIGAPLLLSAAIVLLCLMICAIILDLCIFIAAFSSYLIGGKLILRGLLALPLSLSGSAMIAGSGLLIIGLGILIMLFGIFAAYSGCRFFAASVKWIVNRKRKVNEVKYDETISL